MTVRTFRFSVTAMTDVGDRVREIDGATTAIAAAIEQQGAATSEIARNISQTTSAALEVSAKIQGVSNGADNVNGRAKDIRACIGEGCREACRSRHYAGAIVCRGDRPGPDRTI
jgi:methyl-accepting chemotaxis protein